MINHTCNTKFSEHHLLHQGSLISELQILNIHLRQQFAKAKQYIYNKKCLGPIFSTYFSELYFLQRIDKLKLLHKIF